MIAASEPLEFVPRGRPAVEEHPGPLNLNQENGTTSNTDHLLLLRMQNVNISRDDDRNEYWTIRDIYEDDNSKDDENLKNDVYAEHPSYMVDLYVNSEEELYFKGNTAVWTRGYISFCNVYIQN